MPIEDVGTGVGYCALAALRCLGWLDLVEEHLVGVTSRATRFAALGRGGDEEYISKAGSSDGTGAGLLTPATGDVLPMVLCGDVSIS